MEIPWGFGIGFGKVTLSGHVEVAMRVSYSGQQTIFRLFSYSFPTSHSFVFLNNYTGGNPCAFLFSSVLLLGD